MRSSNHNLGIANGADECALPPSFSATSDSSSTPLSHPDFTTAVRSALRRWEGFQACLLVATGAGSSEGGAWLTPRTAAAVCESAATIGRPFKATGHPNDSGGRLREFPGTCGPNHPREMTAAGACVSAAPLASAVRGPSLHPGRLPLCRLSDGPPARRAAWLPFRPSAYAATAAIGLGAYAASPASS